MKNGSLFPKIPVTYEFPQLPFNYHEPMTGVEKNGNSYRVYYTIARETHILIVESYDGTESYYRSFNDESFMVDGTFQASCDTPVILDIINDGFKVATANQLRKKLSATVEIIFGKK